jgi:uncharacterized membrane protein
MEWVQATSKGSFTNVEYRSGWHKLWEMTKDYYGVWNLLDILRIILMALYVIFTIGYLVNKQELDEEDATKRPRILKSNDFLNGDTTDEILESENSLVNWDEKRAEIFTLLVLVSFICLL